MRRADITEKGVDVRPSVRLFIRSYCRQILPDTSRSSKVWPKGNRSRGSRIRR